MIHSTRNPIQNPVQDVSARLHNSDERRRRRVRVQGWALRLNFWSFNLTEFSIIFLIDLWSLSSRVGTSSQSIVETFSRAFNQYLVAIKVLGWCLIPLPSPVSCPVGHFLDLSDSSTTQQCKPCGFAFYQVSQSAIFKFLDMLCFQSLCFLLCEQSCL